MLQTVATVVNVFEQPCCSCSLHSNLPSCKNSDLHVLRVAHSWYFAMKNTLWVDLLSTFRGVAPPAAFRSALPSPIQDTPGIELRLNPSKNSFLLHVLNSANAGSSTSFQDTNATTQVRGMAIAVICNGVAAG